DAGDTSERFGLFWPGKKRAMRAAQDPTTATLKPAKDLSKDWDTTQNIFIEGDNLEVLKVLQKQSHNSIKMIYIDPPYNTGKDFVYPDNFKEGLQNYLEFSKQVDEGNKKISTNTETAGRYHSNWLNMMYPRLKLARNLLTDDGVIFVSIDDYEYDNLAKVAIEIFGESNYSTTFIRQRKKKPSFLHANAGRMTEYVLCLTRNSKDTFPFSVDTTTEGKKYPLNNAGNSVKVLTFPAGTVKFTSAQTHYDPQDMSEGNIITRLLDPIDITDGRNEKDFRLEGEWRYSQAKVNEIIENGETIVISKAPFRPNHVKTGGEVKQMHNLLTPQTYGVGTNEDATAEVIDLMGGDYFDNPKPVSLVSTLTKSVTYNDPDATILDFFSGSGTTAHAVMQLNAEDGGNRKHIQVQLPEPTDEKSEAYKAGYRKISDIARERINRAGEKIKVDYADKLAERNTPLDVGYRTYQLSDTNFRKWQSSATNDLGELQARLDLMRESADDNASEEDLLVEVMLKMGLPLTSRTELRDVAGLHVHQVVSGDDEHSDVQPVFYLNEHVKPTLEQLRAIVTELTPSKFVILDDAFQHRSVKAGLNI
ncbi:MAG TPA: site-specific DNA-methyltransferase, partial [Candidatus Saccharibacteria bacterium]|nr:site-specific DNA-methyltransferase [Candidatus Saccharibacteria bacterium]